MNWDSIIMNQTLSYEFLEKHLYKYSLYIDRLDKCVNKNDIITLQKKYTNKYEIDKISDEFRF